MFYQSAADSELLCVAGPGDVALSKDKQADKNSHRHSFSLSEAPWRRGKEQRMTNRNSCRTTPHLLRSCTNVKYCCMLEWDIDSCLNRSSSCVRSPWKSLAVLLYVTDCSHISTKDRSLTVHHKSFPSYPKASKDKKKYLEIIIENYSFCPVDNVPTQLQAAILRYHFISTTASTCGFFPLNNCEGFSVIFQQKDEVSWV